MRKNLQKHLTAMQKKTNTNGMHKHKFKFVEERVDTSKPSPIPYIIIANHSIIEVRNTPTIHLVDAVRIATIQQGLQIHIEGDMISYTEGHLKKAVDFIEYSLLKN